MAVTRSFSYTTGQTIYGVFRKGSDGTVWNTSGTPAYEAANAGHWAQYAIACGADVGGLYSILVPATIPAGDTLLTLYLQAGGSPATTDTIIGTDEFDSDGSAGLVSFINARLNLAAVLSAPRDVSAVADASLTLNDALWGGLCGAAGKQAVTGTSYTISTPSTGTQIRGFTLDSSTNPTSRS